MRWRTNVALAAVVTTLAGCAQSVPAPPATYDRPTRDMAPIFEGAQPLPPPDLTNDGAGSLVRVEPVVDNADFEDANATAVKIVYRSTAGLDGAPTEVSGLVAVPPGTPPEGGWPIVSFGHEMSGVLSKCAPSKAPDFLGYSSQMTTFVSRGYAVALPDYQGLGLGEDGHSIIDAATLGNNMIDAARAVRRVLPTTSNRWAAFGVGEGGLAAWSAAERAGVYGAGLEMVGAVAISPYADLQPLADAAAAGTLAKGEQSRLYMMVLQSLALTQPDFDLDAYRAGLAREHWRDIIDCAPPNPAEVVRVLDRIAPDDLRPRDAAATDDLRRRLSEAALPADNPIPGAAPVLVIWGTDDTVVPAAGIDRAVMTACGQGQRIELDRRIGDTKPVNDQVINGALSWLNGRFDNQQLADVCTGAA